MLNFTDPKLQEKANNSSYFLNPTDEQFRKYLFHDTLNEMDSVYKPEIKADIVRASIIKSVDFFAYVPSNQKWVQYMNSKYKITEFAEHFFEHYEDDETLAQTYSEEFIEVLDILKLLAFSQDIGGKDNYNNALYFVTYLHAIPFADLWEYRLFDTSLSADDFKKHRNFLNDITKQFPAFKTFTSEVTDLYIEKAKNKDISLEKYVVNTKYEVGLLFFENCMEYNRKKLASNSKKISQNIEQAHEYSIEFSFHLQKIEGFVITIYHCFFEKLRLLNINYLFDEVRSKNNILEIYGLTIKFALDTRRSLNQTQYDVDTSTIPAILKTIQQPPKYGINLTQEIKKDNFVNVPKIVHKKNKLMNLFFPLNLEIEDEKDANIKLIQAPFHDKFIYTLLNSLPSISKRFNILDDQLVQEKIPKDYKIFADSLISDIFDELEKEIMRNTSPVIRKKELARLEKDREELYNSDTPLFMQGVYGLIIHNLFLTNKYAHLSKNIAHMITIQEGTKTEDVLTVQEQFKDRFRTLEKQHHRDMAKLQKENELLEAKNNGLNKELSTLPTIKNQLLETQTSLLSTQRENELLKEELAYAQDQLKMLESSEELTEQSKNQKSEIQVTLDGHAFTDDIYSNFIELLNTDKTLIVGGHETCQKRMKEMLPHAMVQDPSALGHDIQSWVKRMNFIVLNTHVMNHSMSKAIKAKLNNNNIPILYINSRASNQRVTFSLIYDEYRKYYENTMPI